MADFDLGGISKEIRLYITDKLDSPFWIPFIFSWGIWNHRFIMVVFSGLTPAEKFFLIDEKLYSSNYYLEPFVGHLLYEEFIWGKLFFYPFLTSIILISVVPRFFEIVIKVTGWYKNRFLAIQNDLQGKAPLTEDDRINLLTQLRKTETQYKSQISGLEDEISDLKQINDKLITESTTKEQMDTILDSSNGAGAYVETDESESNNAHSEDDNDETADLSEIDRKIISILGKSGIKLSEKLFAVEIKVPVTYIRNSIDKLTSKGILDYSFDTRKNKVFELTPFGRSMYVELHPLNEPNPTVKVKTLAETALSELSENNSQDENKGHFIANVEKLNDSLSYLEMYVFNILKKSPTDLTQENITTQLPAKYNEIDPLSITDALNTLVNLNFINRQSKRDEIFYSISPQGHKFDLIIK